MGFRDVVRGVLRYYAKNSLNTIQSINLEVLLIWYPVVSTPGPFDTRSFRHFLVVSTPNLVISTPPKKNFAKSGRFDTLSFFALHRIFRYYFVLTYFRVYVYILLFYYCRWTIILVDTTMELYMWRVGIEEYRNVLFVSDNSNNYLFNI